MKTFSSPRIQIDHPRAPAPSRAFLWVRLDWLRGDAIATCDLTENQLYDLAEEALKIAAILRRQGTG